MKTVKQRNRAVPAVYLIMRREQNVLLVRRQGSGYYDGWYSLPAGHVEAGELPVAALIRETQEELGLRLEQRDLVFAHALYRMKSDESGDRIDFFFLATTWKGEPTIQEPHKCDQLHWCPFEELPENTVPYVRQALESIRRGVYYAELDAQTMRSFPK